SKLQGIIDQNTAALSARKWSVSRTALVCPRFAGLLGGNPCLAVHLALLSTTGRLFPLGNFNVEGTRDFPSFPLCVALFPEDVHFPVTSSFDLAQLTIHKH